MLAFVVLFRKSGWPSLEHTNHESLLTESNREVRIEKGGGAGGVRSTGVGNAVLVKLK